MKSEDSNQVETAISRIFGKSPFIKIVDTLMDHPTYEYTKTELAEVNEISRSTLYRVWDKLEELEIVEPTKRVGSTQLYKLNTDSKLVEKLYKFEKSMMEDDETRELMKA